MNFDYRSTSNCVVCGKAYWGLPDDTCTPCAAILRAWVAKGFLDLCHYLEKVTEFEAYLEAHQESSDDPAPADALDGPIGANTPAVPNSEGELDTHTGCGEGSAAGL